MNALEIEGISKRFDDFYAVKKLSFEIPSGTIYGLLGPNGAGKTTTIRMVMNIIIPDEGSIKVLNRGMDEEMKERVGYLPEDRGLYPKMKVRELLVFLAEIKGLKRNEARKEIDFWLERFDLSDWRDKKVEELSRGMQQRLCLGRALINDPDIFIMDEPAANLDPRARVEFRELVKELAKRNKGILISSHILRELSEICDSITIIDRGKILKSGNMEDINAEITSGIRSIQIGFEPLCQTKH